MTENKPKGIFDGLSLHAETLKINEKHELTLDNVTDIDSATNFIRENDAKITNAWFNMCHVLKKVRDNELYKSKYSTFEGYFETELKYSKKMVYNFIKIAEVFPLQTKEQIIDYGVTKLINLAELNENDRNELLDENNIKEMSVKELKQKVRDITTISSNKNNMQINLTPEEHNFIKTIHIEFDGTNKIIKDIAVNDSPEIKLTYPQITYLNSILKKTKRDIQKIEKIVKKYL
jgi:hypothetical protein